MTAYERDGTEVEALLTDLYLERVLARNGTDLGPADADLDPAQYPAVQQAVEVVYARRRALTQAEAAQTQAQRGLDEAEAEAMRNPESLIDLTPQRQAVEQAQHLVTVRQRGVTEALAAGATAFQAAATQRYAALWARYQRQVATLCEALRAAYRAQEGVHGVYAVLQEAARVAGVEVDLVPACRPGLGNAMGFCGEMERDIVRQPAPLTLRHEFPRMGIERADYGMLFARAMGETPVRTGYTVVRFRSAAELEARGLSIGAYRPDETAAFSTLEAEA